MNRATGIIRRLAVIAFAIIAGLGIYLFNAQTLVGNQMPMPFGFGAAVVLSGSMEPELSVDDLVIVKEQENYEVGDVVVYQEQDYMVIHRIVAIEGSMVQTKGDANNASDEPIDRSYIKGKMVAAIPMMGVIVQMLKTPVGIIVVLGAAVFLMEYSFRRDRKRDEKELENIKDEIRKLKGEL